MYGQEQANVDVRLKADPTNAYDANAICVQIDYEQGWKLVGFLLKDLTQFVHPVMQSDSLSSVKVGDIRFRTHWSTRGFYMKIKIKCKGVWLQQVVRASQRVQQSPENIIIYIYRIYSNTRLLSNKRTTPINAPSTYRNLY